MARQGVLMRATHVHEAEVEVHGPQSDKNGVRDGSIAVPVE